MLIYGVLTSAFYLLPLLDTLSTTVSMQEIDLSN